MEVIYASINEQGKRPYQEDSLGMTLQGEDGFFLVADGLGGHGLGNVASREAADCASRLWRKSCDPKDYLNRIFDESQKRLLQLQDEKKMPNSMKTTLVCAVLKNKTLYGAYAGDSRLYVFRKGKIVYRTLDHSIPQMLVAAGEMKEKKIRNHPDRNKLLRVLGDRENEIRPQFITPMPLENQMALLLCTDGFWENIWEKEMERTLAKAKSPTDWVKRMKTIVGIRGCFKNQDNYSAVCVWIPK